MIQERLALTFARAALQSYLGVGSRDQEAYNHLEGQRQSLNHDEYIVLNMIACKDST